MIQRNNAIPYSVVEDPETPNTFTFEINNRVFCEVRFKPSDYLFSGMFGLDGCIFEFVLAVLILPPGVKQTPDSRIAPTVGVAITGFLKADPNRVIAYICDLSDRRELARKCKFDQWFDTFTTNDFRKQEGTLTDTDGLRFYTAALWQWN